MKIFLIVIAVLIIAFSGLTFHFFNTVFNRDRWSLLSKDKDGPYETANKEGRDWLYSNKNTEELSIKSFDGLTLKGIFIRNDVSDDRTILCVHGYQMSGLEDFGMSVRFLCSTGYNVLLTDDRAHGLSEGRYTGFSILDSKDIVSWCKYLVNDLKQAQIVLYGKSMGGATVLNAAGDADIPAEVKGVVSDCSFKDPYAEIAYQIKRAYHLPPYVFVTMYDLWLKIFAGYSLKDLRPLDSVRNIRIPLLLIHGNSDHLVPLDNAYELDENADTDKELLVVDGASHGKSYLVDKEKYEQKFAELLKKADNL